MANHKSSLKRIRSNNTKRVYNRYYSTTMRNAIRSFRALTEKSDAAQKLSPILSLIDKNAKRGIIHKNKAANLKSKLTKRKKCSTLRLSSLTNCRLLVAMTATTKVCNVRTAV